MASDLISREALLELCRRTKLKVNPWDDPFEVMRKQGAMFKSAIENAPSVDAIPIDTVAEMLADLFGDECACNYNRIDEMLSIGCEKANCPDDGDHSCWKKYIKYWMVKKDATE